MATVFQGRKCLLVPFAEQWWSLWLHAPNGHVRVVQANPRPERKLKKIHWEVNDQVEGTVFSRSPTVQLTPAAFAELDEAFQVSKWQMRSIA